ncbi:rCG46894, partial [Rattus norvegicus]
MYCFFICRFEH